MDRDNQIKMTLAFGGQRVFRLYMALFVMSAVTIGLSKLTGVLLDAGSRSHVAILVVSLVLGLLFSGYLVWMTFSPVPDRRTGARVYMARCRPGRKVFAVLPIATGFLLAMDAVELCSVLSLNPMASRMAFLVCLALVFSLPFSIVCVVLFRRLCSVEESSVAYCFGCGHDLSGITTHTCPECGRVYDTADLALEEPG